MLEAICNRCGQTFVPADENDLTHEVKDNGQSCGGRGRLTRLTYTEVELRVARDFGDLPPFEEKLYLVCDCGEAFDDMQIAYAHAHGTEHENDGPVDFNIVPESEAF